MMVKKKVAKNEAQKLRPHVKKVLLAAAQDPERPFLTAFQILDRLPLKVRTAIIQLRQSAGGDKAYVRRAASLDVKDAARVVADEIVQMSTHNVEFLVDGVRLKPSAKNHLALYRINPLRKLKNKSAVKRKLVKADRPAIGVREQ